MTNHEPHVATHLEDLNKLVVTAKVLCSEHNYVQHIGWLRTKNKSNQNTLQLPLACLILSAMVDLASGSPPPPGVMLFLLSNKKH